MSHHDQLAIGLNHVTQTLHQSLLVIHGKNTSKDVCVTEKIYQAWSARISICLYAVQADWIFCFIVMFFIVNTSQLYDVFITQVLFSYCPCPKMEKNGWHEFCMNKTCKERCGTAFEVRAL